MGKNISKILPKETVKQAQRWQCPNVGNEGLESRNATGAGILTAEKLESVQREAFKQAYKEGYAKGFEKGVANGKQTLLPAIKNVNQIALALIAPLQDVSEQVQQQLFELAVLISRQIVRREIKTDPGQIVAVVREAIAALPVSSNRLQIRVVPEDRILLQDVFVNAGEAELWCFIDDITLQRGDCKVTTEFSSIDATVETRLTAIINGILGGERDQDGIPAANRQAISVPNTTGLIDATE